MKKIFKILLIVLMGMMIWYYRPLTIEDVLQVNLYDVKDVSILILEPSGSFYYDQYGNPQSDSFFNEYKLEISSTEDRHYENILSILKNTKYHSKLRNSLPFEFDLSNQDFIYSGYIWFTSDNGLNCISFMGDNRIVIYKQNQKTKVYHMSNQKILNELAEYMKKHGILEVK